ncbi:hypothetical protein DFO83_111100 [Idiomarina loihiensis]|nr:hypothetical protein DFO83_111100 [Idiomarina loihiensis]TDP43709.1 hypothetical protein DET58_1186 [Idiomarina loihiensis]TDS18460.1 hypothetical protein DET62_1186 [Idiomarina sp. H2]
MSDSLKEKQRLRIAYLNKVYELSSADTDSLVNGVEAAAQIGMGNGQEDEIRTIANYLEGEGLLKVVARVMGGFPANVRITHAGIKEIEGAISRPDQPTEHFMPINILNVETMIGSNIQQGTIGSSQNIEFSTDFITELQSFVAELKDQQSNLDLGEEEGAEFNSEVATIEAQMVSPKPKRAILKECLGSLKRILEAAAGGAAGSTLAAKVPLLLAML